MSNRKWNKGKPPFDGWWNVRTDIFDKEGEIWPFFCNGVWWHCMVDEEDTHHLEKGALTETSFKQDEFEWCDYWPENARVPRINPDAKSEGVAG